jgi:hypothetical protein
MFERAKTFHALDGAATVMAIMTTKKAISSAMKVFPYREIKLSWQFQKAASFMSG